MSDNDSTLIPDPAPQASAESTKLRLTRPHSLIQRTLDIKVERDQWGHTRQPPWPGVDVRVSKAEKRNALIVLDRLFKALEKQGVEVTVLHGGYDRTEGTYAVREREDRVQVYVTEENKKVPHVPTAKELHEKNEPISSRIPKYDSVPTGKLTLVPGGVVDLSSEESLAKLIAKSVGEIVQNLDQERERRKRAAEERRREYTRQKEEQEEKGRVESLHNAAKALRRYREMMDYIEEVRRFGRVPDGQRREGQTLDEWIRWAEWQARIIHPIG